MKIAKLVLLILLISVSSTIRAQGVDGVMGIKFYSNEKTVDAAMKARGAKHLPEYNIGGMRVYTGGRFGEYSPYVIRFYFYGGQMYRCAICIKPDYESKILELYTSVASDLAGKYGAPGWTIEEYRSPFSKDDNHFPLALKEGYVDLIKKWALNPSIKLVYITVVARPIMDVEVIYEETKISRVLNDSIKEMHKRDY